MRLNKSISRDFNVVNNSFCEIMFIALNSEKDLGSDQESRRKNKFDGVSAII